MLRITPLVLTFNEAANIGRCLERLAWAPRVVVLDSGSTDETEAIARRFPNVDWHVREFDDHASQWNHGLGLARTPWVLTLDADYVLPADFAASVPDAAGNDGTVDAAFASFRYCIFGRPLRGSLYPPRAVFVRPDRCHYRQDGHTQVLEVAGRSIQLPVVIDHDDRKSIGRWLTSQVAYARLEARKLRKQPANTLSFPDRVRTTILLAPVGAFLHAWIGKGTIFNGWAGCYYALQRAAAELILSLTLLDERLRGR